MIISRTLTKINKWS